MGNGMSAAQLSLVSKLEKKPARMQLKCSCIHNILMRRIFIIRQRTSVSLSAVQQPIQCEDGEIIIYAMQLDPCHMYGKVKFP